MKAKRLIVRALSVTLALVLGVGLGVSAWGLLQVSAEAQVARVPADHTFLLGSPEERAISHKYYPMNESGQTYGADGYSRDPDMPPNVRPDLILAIGIDGTEGYILRTDLEGPIPKNPEEALKIMEESEKRGPYNIPLYKADGKTIIGAFRVGGE